MGNILVIDDDEIFLAVLTRALQLAGHVVSVTADGPRAIAMFQETRPEIVLLDIGLPSMSGIDVLRAIRDIDAHARVIVVTGYGSSEVRNAAVRYGASDFLLKPIDPELLLDRIRLALAVGA